MRARPIYRITLFLLPALLLCNILLFAWFSRKARETADAEVVQKAYIVSRMLSTFASRSLEREALSPLKKVVEEAFKDKHIVSVTILDKEGDVIIQSAIPGTHEQLSTFETPIIVGEKSAATLVTGFSLEESGEVVGRRLRTTGWLQAALFAAIALALAWLCRRESLAAANQAVAAETAAPLAPALPINSIAAPSAPLPEWWGELAATANSLQRASELLAASAERQGSAAAIAGERLMRIGEWQQQAQLGGESARSLIDSSFEIVAMVREGVADRGEVVDEVNGAVGATGELDGIIASVGGILRELEGEDGKLLTPDGSVVAAAALVREGVETMRQRVFPSLAAAVAAGETVASRLAPLLESVDDCGDRSSDITRRSGELIELADGLRLLRREISSSAVGDGVEGGLNLLAERLESIASCLKRESQEILAATNGAIASGRAILTAVEDSRQRLLAAGCSVEDAAASSVMGSDHLRRFLADAGMGDGDVTAGEGEELKSLLRELLARLELLRQEAAQPLPKPSGGEAHSLAVACDNLLMAGRFLADVASLVSELAGEPCSGEQRETLQAEDSVSQLIAAASLSLASFRSRLASGLSKEAEDQPL